MAIASDSSKPAAPQTPAAPKSMAQLQQEAASDPRLGGFMYGPAEEYEHVAFVTGVSMPGRNTVDMSFRPDSESVAAGKLSVTPLGVRCSYQDPRNSDKRREVLVPWANVKVLTVKAP